MLRKTLHDKVNDPVIDGSGRSAAIGISTLVAFNDGNKMVLWLKRRSKKGVAVSPGLISVLPSGIFQPVTDFLGKEFSIRHNICREYLEELFDRPEVREPGTEIGPDFFYNDPCLQHLFTLLGMEKAELLFSGIAIDLLTLRPEICSLLVIKTPGWFSYHSSAPDPKERFKFNLEFTLGQAEQDTLSWTVEPLPFPYEDSDMLKYQYLAPFRMTSAGAGAFWLGVDQLRNLLKNGMVSG